MREPSHSLAGRFVELARITRLAFPVPDDGLAGPRLTPRQAQALVATHAAGGETTATELGAALGVDRSTLHGALDELAAKGWLKRVADPNDGRRRKIILLADGRRAAAEYVDAAQARIEDAGVPLDRI